MKSSPLVSVLMTVYNREKYVAGAIESVLQSTYSDFELIIADDRSTDNSLDIALSFAKKDHRIQIIRNQSNLGDYPNRNKAASLARGKYLKYLDSDDILYAHGLEVMVNSMESFPEAGSGFPDFQYRGRERSPFLVNSRDAWYRHYFMGGFLYMGPTGSIYRNEVFKKLGGFNPDYGPASDLAFNLESSMHHPVVVFDRDLFRWRSHEEQEINQKRDLYEPLNDQINSYYLLHAQCPLEKKLPQQAFNNLKNILARRTWRALCRLNFRQATERIKRYKLTLTQLLLAPLPSVLRRKLQ